MKHQLQQAEAEMREAALNDLAYVNGVKMGWSLCAMDNEAGFQRITEARVPEAMRAIKELRAKAAPQQAEVVSQLTRDFPAVQQSRAVVERQTERYRELMGDDVKNTLKQPQYEAGDMASAHNDGFRAGVASVVKQPQEPEMTPAFRSSNAYTVGFQDGKAQALAQQPQAEAVPSGYMLVTSAAVKDMLVAADLLSTRWKARNAAVGRRLAEHASDAVAAAIAAQGEKP